MVSAPFRNCLAALVLGTVLLAPPASAAPISAVAEYAVSLGGTHMADVEITLDDDGA